MKWWMVLLLDNFTWEELILTRYVSSYQVKLSRKRTFRQLSPQKQLRNIHTTQLINTGCWQITSCVCTCNTWSTRECKNIYHCAHEHLFIVTLCRAITSCMLDDTSSHNNIKNYRCIYLSRVRYSKASWTSCHYMYQCNYNYSIITTTTKSSIAMPSTTKTKLKIIANSY